MMKNQKKVKISLHLVCAVMALTVVESALAESGATSASYLYIQSATSGTIAKNSDGTSAYTVTLNGVSPETVKFTDHPLRIANTVSTTDFIKHWNIGTDNFKLDHPNAVLNYTENHQLRTLDVVTISEPHYDSQNHVLSYRAVPVSKNSQLSDIANISRPSLFIDLKWF